MLHPLTSMDRSSKQKINKGTSALNNTLDQIDLIDLKNIPPKSNRTHILLKCTGNILQKRFMLGHKMSLNKLKKN